MGLDEIIGVLARQLSAAGLQDELPLCVTVVDLEGIEICVAYAVGEHAQDMFDSLEAGGTPTFKVRFVEIKRQGEVS